MEQDTGDFLSEYRFALTRAVTEQGARDVRIERELYRGGGKAIFALSASYWPTDSELNPGNIRCYTVIPSGPGQALMREVGTMLPADLESFDILAGLQD